MLSSNTKFIARFYLSFGSFNCHMFVSKIEIILSLLVEFCTTFVWTFMMKLLWISTLVDSTLFSHYHDANHEGTRLPNRIGEPFLVFYFLLPTLTVCAINKKKLFFFPFTFENIWNSMENIVRTFNHLGFLLNAIKMIKYLDLRIFI